MSAAVQPNTASKPLPKVLRLGLIKDGKVTERITKIGEVVSVGEDSRNLFVVTEPNLGQRVDIFIPQRDGYLMQVPEWVEGMVQTKDGMKSLVDLRSNASSGTQKKGDLWVYLLDERMRGKLVIGATSILFQFVPAPPQPERAMSPADFRAKWYDDEDPLFLVLLGTFTVIAASFMVWIYVTPRVDDADLANVDDAAKLLTDDIEPIVIEIAAPDVGDAPAEKPKEKEKAAETTEKPATPAASAAKPTVESVAKKSLLLQALGTFGEGTAGTAANMLGDDAQAMEDLDKALAGVSGAQQANGANLGQARSGGQGGRGDATLGVSTAAAGSAESGSAVVVKVKKPKIDYGNADTDVESGDGGAIPSVVRKKAGTFQSCVEAGLKQDDSMSGRVSLSWSIVEGKVTNVQKVENTTGNDALLTCFSTGVRGLRFDASLTAEVAAYTWSVSGQ